VVQRQRRFLLYLLVATASVLAWFVPLIGARANESMLLAAKGMVRDGSGAPVLLRCVNLSPWLVPEGYLIAQGDAARLKASPSEIRQRLESVVGPDKALAFWRDWTTAFVDAPDFQHLKRQGFNCVRLPFNANFLTRHLEPDAVEFDEAGIAPVDAAVAWGAAYGVYVFLDLHCAPGGQNPLAAISDVPSADRVARLWQGPTAAENRRRTIALWRALAARYASARSVGGYDLLNEPDLPAGVPETELATFYEAVITTIRTVDPAHMIVVEGDHYAHDFSALGAIPGDNLMYEFHAYAIFTPAWRTPTRTLLAPLLMLRRATQRPLWLGEFGEDMFDWQKRMVALMKANNIGWAVWPWKRVYRGNGAPVAETITTPMAWKDIADYLAGDPSAHKPSPQLAEQTMAEMLRAVRTHNCQEDTALIKVLAGR
jgi:endoglucanase